MPVYARLAFRNIFRNRMRTLITLLVVGSGAAAMIIAGGFIVDTISQVREMTIRDRLGHLRIYKNGFLEQGVLQPYGYMIGDVTGLLKEISAQPHVIAAGPRLSYFGLIGNGDLTLSFFMQAFDPAREDRVRNTASLVAGEFTQPGKPFDVMLGEGLAKALNLRVGDSAVLLGNTERGGMNAADVNVGGIFRTISSEFDNGAIRAPIQLAQRLLRVDGAQMIIVFLDRTDATDGVKQNLLRLFKARGLDYEIQAWHEMPEATVITTTARVYESIYRVIKIILFLFIILSIINTMNMAVLERVGEIGTLMALGTQRRGILKMFIAEGMAIGVLGGVAGCAAGCLLAILISAVGIHMPSPPGSSMEWIAHIALTPGTLLTAFAMALATSLMASILPAYKASRMEVGEALRRNI